MLKTQADVYMTLLPRNILHSHINVQIHHQNVLKLSLQAPDEPPPGRRDATDAQESVGPISFERGSGKMPGSRHNFTSVTLYIHHVRTWKGRKGTRKGRS